MSKQKFLLVEDDPNLGQILSEYLTVKGFEPTLRTDGESGLEAFRSDTFDLCILDVMLPKKDGFSLAKDIREKDKEVPIIFLTAKSMKEDTIKGFKLGADDYMTKPFSMEELLLRIQAILRRAENSGKNKTEDSVSAYKIGKTEFDSETRDLRIQGTDDRRLTAKEAGLLKLLCMNRNSTLERSVALKTLWNDDSYFNARSMDVYIAKLRKYLKPDNTIEILTVHGEGFKLVELE
ncbi:DNA-binding response regulator [Fulvitalea axinellae]|uniref:DNA-binding response regulator n=1 Tax=Fulvitalea axinellae TaxID=1182444 RepID=A0AAU9CTE5_9BACT|nr:DNA-binding response regulator [Fulvitalea axinellae]